MTAPVTTNTAAAIPLWICAIGSALVADTFFAFSAFVIASFARVEPA